jgi:Fe-Mn family superoxide dismutase
VFALTRRHLLKWAGGALAVSCFAKDLGPVALAQGTRQPPAGPFTLPDLPYPADALTAAIDRQTMEIHHDRHHAAYVTGLNTALAAPAYAELRRRPIERILREINQVPEAIRQAVTNNGGGHYNHSMFWTIMGPRAGGNPAGSLAEAINSTFTSLDNFKNQFRAAALARFGSGWAWLVYADRRLQITHTANQDCPLMSGRFPILGLDVWEHAYYLRYQNRRADYVNAWWNVVNWPAVRARFDQARQG